MPDNYPANSEPTDSPSTCGDIPIMNAAVSRPFAGASGPCRYRRLDLHAEGGLGAVYRARDEELGRIVALKEIQDSHADQRGSQARFIFEAEVTGNLEHPGIVPVYGLGTNPDGRPYYAMRFIHGASLEEEIHRFHAKDDSKRDPSERVLALRGLLRRFIDVCNAVAYAHSRGVIHRDIKPANIMLGTFGETLVVDWGLARLRRDEGPSAGGSQSTNGEAVIPTSALGMMGTIEGAAVGTPAYMPPEQALGLHEEVGPRSDVYSLGATLYQLLTGKNPFSGTTVEEVLERVVRGDCEPACQVKPSVDAALQAVCQKAMASRAENRYESARALAQEVERWLADEPVSAYDEPFTVRASRWVKRRQTMVASAAALLVTAVVFLAVIAVLKDRERRRSDRERADTERQYQRAETLHRLAHENLGRAMRAVDEMTRLADERLTNVPDFDEDRRELLQQALVLYGELLDQNSDDPVIRLESGKSHVRMGDVHKLLSEDARAGRYYDQAIELLTRLTVDYPGVPEYEKALAHAHGQKGLLAWSDDTDRRRLFTAEACFRRAMPIWERLESSDIEARSEVAIGNYRLSCILVQTAREAEGEQLFAKTVQMQKELLRKASSTKDIALLGSIQNSAAAHYLNSRQWQKAEQMSRAGLAIFEKLRPINRKVLKYQYELAYSYHTLGIACSALDRPKEAAEYFRMGMDVFEDLVRVHPNLPQYQEEIASSLDDWAEMYESRGKLAEAEKSYRDALAVRRKIADKFTKATFHARKLAQTHVALGKILARQGKDASARESYREALADLEKLTHKPGNVDSADRARLGRTHVLLGESLRKAGKTEEARQQFTMALRAFEAVPKMEWEILAIEAAAAKARAGLAGAP